MRDDELPARILKELAAEMPTIDLAKVDNTDLLDAGKQAVRRRRNDQVIIGRIGAEFRRRGRSIRSIAAELDVKPSTLYYWTKPFMEAA